MCSNCALQTLVCSLFNSFMVRKSIPKQSIKREGFWFLFAYFIALVRARTYSGCVSPSPSIILCEMKHAMSLIDKLFEHCRNLCSSFEEHALFRVGFFKHKPLPLLSMFQATEFKCCGNGGL